MRNIFLLISLIFLFSCSNVTEGIIENTIPERDNLEIAIKNNTPFKFTRTEIDTNSGSQVFQQIEPNYFSEIHEFDYVYSEEIISVQTENGFYTFNPINYDESTKVTKGRYYFEISISSPITNEIQVVRKSF